MSLTTTALGTNRAQRAHKASSDRAAKAAKAVMRSLLLLHTPLFFSFPKVGK